MKIAFTIVQIILSITLASLIFLQSNGESESRSNIISSTNHQKRGWEKVVFDFTILVLVLFLISSIIQTLI